MYVSFPGLTWTVARCRQDQRLVRGPVCDCFFQRTGCGCSCDVFFKYGHPRTRPPNVRCSSRALHAGTRAVAVYDGDAALDAEIQRVLPRLVLFLYQEVYLFLLSCRERQEWVVVKQGNEDSERRHACVS